MKSNEWDGKIKEDIGRILRILCENKGVEILEANACPDHIHTLLSILARLSVSKFMGYLKGKSSLMIFDRIASFGVEGIMLIQSEETRR